jgi:phosphoglycolate phosphatase
MPAQWPFAYARTVNRLVLWDIDRTLVYVGEVDRRVYREVFAELVGRPAEVLPAKGTGLTVPLAVRELFVSNGVEPDAAELLAAQALEQIPRRFAAHRGLCLEIGVLLPGAVEALRAVADLPGTVATVVTGNLQHNAEAKLAMFELDQYVDTTVGGYSSDNPDRPRLVAVAQQRASKRYGVCFGRHNTVIIGDSLEDVTTAQLGGAAVIGVTSGTTCAEELRAAGAEVVMPDLCDPPALVDAVLRLTASADATENAAAWSGEAMGRRLSSAPETPARGG